LPTGVSWQSRRRQVATETIIIPGTTKATLQATWGVRPLLTRESKIEGIRKYVTPPPALPKPAVKAFAVPTIFLS